VITYIDIMARGDSYQLQGQQGGVVLSGADSATGSFRWIQAIEDTVLLCDTGETAGNLSGISYLDNKTLAAGTGLGGKFTKVEIGSGTAVVYTD
jgi:hypothetical protein